VADIGGIDGIVGAEHEGTEAETAVAGADAIALAIAMDTAKHDPELARKAGNYLEEQHALVRLQVKFFDEERRLAIAAAERKRLTDRLRNGFMLFVALVVAAVILGLGDMAWDAANDRGLVVEPFSVPPDLVQRGLTGQVMAKQVLDRLSDLQSQTETMRTASSYRNNWGDDIKVEIPETGVSVGELKHYLRESLGHETHISGEVYRTLAGLTITARVGEESGASFDGTDADLKRLVQRAAEAVYERTQPYRYAVYLDREGPTPEGAAVLDGLAQSADPIERAWAHVHSGVLAMSKGDVAAQTAGMLDALAEVPDFAPALWNLAYGEADLGHDSEAARQAAAFLASQRSIRLNIAAAQRDAVTVDVLWLKYQIEGDYQEAIRQARSLVMAPNAHEMKDDGRSDLPRSLVFDHDLLGARAATGRMAADDPGRLLVPGLAALELGDATAINLLSQAVAMADAWTNDNIHDYLRQPLTPWLAIAKAHFADSAGAKTLIAKTPADCYLCVRARGVIAAAAGDQADAERWFAQAIKQAPGLPQAFVDRGNAHLNWGDAARALADAEHATQLSQYHADAWKLWGDALARQNQRKQALAKYEEALKYAPNWKQLKEMREALAKHAT
jgi:tetratricopeptide (TPR) repeat protein